MVSPKKYLVDNDIDIVKLSSNRKERYLKPHNKIRFPRHILFYDIESTVTKINDKKEIHKFKQSICCNVSLDSFGNIKSEDYFFHYDSKSLFNHFIDSVDKHRSIYIFAHNQNYDFFVSGFIDMLFDNGWRKNFFNIESRSFIVEFNKDNKSIRFVDTLNFFAGSVKSIGDEIGLEKLKMPKVSKKYDSIVFNSKNDYYDLTKSQKQYFDLWYEYNKRDVEIIKKAVIDFIKFLIDNDYGSFGVTLASTSFNVFRYRYLDKKIKIHNNTFALSLERDSYFGGRTEIFYKGIMKNQDYFIVDVTSMYPFVMLEYMYPTRLLGRLSNFDLDYVLKKLDDYHIIANVDVDTNINCIPKRYDGKLVFPIGTFKTTLASPELKDAIKRGIIDKINLAYVYRKDDIFSRFVKDFFNHKNENKINGNKVYSYLYKILLNSLYGKFAQRINDFEMLPYKSELKYSSGYFIDTIRNEKYFTKTINHDVYKIIRNKESIFSIPSISSHVTSYARNYLFTLMEKAGLKNVFYTDTDSLIVNTTGYNNLKSMIKNSELGKLELQDKSRIVKINTVKDYQFGDKIKRKGVPKSFTEIEPNVFEGWHFEKLNSIFTQIEKKSMYTVKMKKVLTGDYDKGFVKSNGNVVPLVFDNDKLVDIKGRKFNI